MKEVFKKIGLSIAAEIEVCNSKVFVVEYEGGGGPDELYLLHKHDIPKLREEAKKVTVCEDCTDEDCTCDEEYSTLQDKIEKYKRASWGYFQEETIYF